MQFNKNNKLHFHKRDPLYIDDPSVYTLCGLKVNEKYGVKDKRKVTCGNCKRILKIRGKKK